MIPGMAEGLRFPELCVAAAGRRPALLLRPWRAADIPALAAEMSHGYHRGGMWPGPDERPLLTVLSPANPPHWFTDGHIHLRQGGVPPQGGR
jgi:hypothetical protein